MLEVRVSPEDKADFIESCRQGRLSASAVIRKAMHTHVRRIQERPGRVKMMMTMMLILPFVGHLQTAQPVVMEQEAVTTEAPVCNGNTVRRAPIWPVGANGEGLTVPEEGIRVILRFDQTEEGRAENIRPRQAPEGYDAFVTAAVAGLRDWCFPEGAPQMGAETAFDFKLALEEG